MTQLMLFYKDKERRFVWMNKAFLDFCGYETLASILGRTDEELALHINERTFREVEEKILTTGRPVHRYLGEAFTLGKSALVYSTKIPFYRHGKIEGLIGLVWEFEKSQLNCRGMLISGMEFMDNYLRSGKDFIAVYFCVPAFAEIVQKYGEKRGCISCSAWPASSCVATGSADPSTLATASAFLSSMKAAGR